MPHEKPAEAQQVQSADERSAPPGQTPIDSPFLQRMLQEMPHEKPAEAQQAQPAYEITSQGSYRRVKPREEGFAQRLGRSAMRDLKGASATVGDVLTGIAEIPYTAAQMGLAGMEAVSPKGSGMASTAQKWREWTDAKRASVGPSYDYLFGEGDTYGREIGQMIGTAPLGALKLFNPATFKGATALGATSSMLSAPTDEKDPGEFFSQKAGQAVLGGALGFGARGLEPVLGGLLRPFGGSKAPHNIKEGMAAADRLGVNLTAANKTGSPHLELLESVAKRVPGSAGKFRALDQANQKAINEAALSAMGRKKTSGDELSGEFLGLIRKDVGKKIGGINKGAFIKRDKLRQMKGVMESIKKENEAMRDMAIPEVTKLIKGFESLIEDGAPEKIAGKTVQKIQTKLNAQINSLSEEKVGYGDIKHALVKFKQLLDEVMTLPAASKVELKQLRRQYAAAKTLGKKNVLKEGKIMPASLSAALRRQYGLDFPEGKMGGELADIARVGRTFRDKVPDSGTATRQMMIDMAGGNPIRLAQGAAMSPAASAYLSKPMQHYLTKGIGPDMSWLSKYLPYASGPYAANKE